MDAERRTAPVSGRSDRRLLGAAVQALAIRSLGPVVAFLMAVLIARLLGAEGAGVLYLAITVAMAASIAARVGLDTTLLRYAGTAWGTGDAAAVRDLLRRSLWVTSAVGLVLTALLMTAAEYLAAAIFNEPALRDVTRIAALVVVPSACICLQASVLKAVGLAGWAALIEGLAMPLLVTLLLVIATLVGTVDAPLVAACYVGGTVLAALLAGRVVVRRLPAATANVTLEPLTKMLVTALPLLSVDLLNFALAWTPLLLLGALAGSVEAGIYNAAQRLALQIGLLVSVFGSITAPRFAVLHSDRQLAAMDSLAIRTTRYMSLLASPALLLLLVWPEAVLGLFGPEFVSAATPLRVLALGQLVNALAGPAGYLLAVSGYERDLRNCQLLTVTTVLALATALIPALGALGAALAASAGLLINNLGSLWLVNRRIGLRLHPGRLVRALT